VFGICFAGLVDTYGHRWAAWCVLWDRIPSAWMQGLKFCDLGRMVLLNVAACNQTLISIEEFGFQMTETKLHAAFSSMYFENLLFSVGVGI
jgi:hypothetical protein